MRKLQLKKYNIDYMFLFDNKDSAHLIHLNIKKDIFFETPHTSSLNPHMIIKFLHGLKLVDESNYDFVLRVNLSTFINIPLLFRELETLPSQKLFAGHCKSEDPLEPDKDPMIWGTFMLFSKDCIGFLKSINIDRIYSDNVNAFTSFNDDKMISQLMLLYTNIYHIPQAWREFGLYNAKSPTDNKDLEKFLAIRIKDTSNRNNDITLWKWLMNLVDNITTQ